MKQPASGKEHHGDFVSCLRVSTARQGQSGLGLEVQRKAVLDYFNGAIGSSPGNTWRRRAARATNARSWPRRWFFGGSRDEAGFCPRPVGPPAAEGSWGQASQCDETSSPVP